ncbi:MAG TPA: orotidine-5'-phosphate decarboxylase [Egibacteraceae bacterium]|nr:orotidine-5'-phosphate decarboxylase [Egibacteraceae bacterium]
MNPLIVALDTTDLVRIRSLAGALAPHVGGLKIGLEAYTALAAQAVAAAAAGEVPVFLDLKLHDIPNTVAGAAAAAAGLGVDLLTVHASGGAEMVAAAVKAAPDVKILGVTVLTSLDDAALAEVGQPSAAAQVPRLAALAIDAGAAGIVCAPPDIAAVRAVIGDGPLVVTPGIRPAGAALGDQRRVATPAQALAAGADRLVIGRPITAADDPVAATRQILEELGFDD